MGTESESDFEKKRSQLSAAKQALLEKRLRGDGKRTAARAAIPRRPDATVAAPLSFSQRRLWFLDQLEPGSSAYNVPIAWRLVGPLSLEALKRALYELRQRHEILRTAYAIDENEPRQRVLQVDASSLELVDLSSLALSAAESELQSQLRVATARPFNLAAGEVFRAHLWRLGADEHVLLLNQHHIASDAWSCGILFRELGSLYRAFSKGEASPLAPLAIQYADFAAWQQQSFPASVLESQAAYWKKQLGGPLPLLELPTDRPRPAVQSYQGAEVEFQISQPTTAALTALAQEHGVTPFMLLLAAFQVLLHRYSRQTDILIGTPLAGRSRSEVEELVGFFVNTIVLRTDVSGDPTFVELLQRVKETALGAYAHQEMPFEKLVETLAPARDQSVSPLFQVMFILQNAPEESFQLAGLSATSIHLPTSTAKFDLSLGMTAREGGFQGGFEYNTDLFDRQTVERMVGHWEQLLWGIAANPQQRLSALPIMRAEERRKIVVDWNQTHRDYPQRELLSGLFEAQVARTPTAEAVVAGTTRVSYRELHQRAENLAHQLRALGVGPEVLVAVCAERSLELIVGLLAVLKAGGAYVPLDPSYPKERIGFMLEDTKALVLLTQRSLVHLLPQHRSSVIFLEETIAEPVVSSISTAVRPTAQNLAYVIYTSGSTGKPKGVAIEHRSAVALVHWAKEVFSPQELSGVLFSTSVCFDLSVFELFVTLSSGGKVILAQNALELPKLPAAGEVTLINTVPSAIAELARLRAIPEGVRVINLAGEPLKTSLVDQLYAVPHLQKVFDLYGPSEDTTYSTFAHRLAGKAATIGRPIANTQLYILDEHQQPVPVGVPGEIYLGGAGLARGYLNRPELTAERFVVNPFSTDSASRLYRTGDLARFRADGEVEFLGRLDHQVKIRGFRIELGEIESALGRHPEVKQCVVLAREDSPGDRRIVAYLEPSSDQEPDITTIRSFLKETLPDYMVPSSFVTLRPLPLTANGKVDRKALPAPERDATKSGKEFEEPRDPVEIHIAKIWERLLEVGPVGLQDNFFELGGHSLLAVHLFAEIERDLGKNLPLATLFHAPTVEELARLVREEGGKISWSSLVPIQPAGRKAPFFCIHAAGGNVLFYRDLALRLGKDQPFYGLQPKGLDGSSERHKTIQEMASHYLREIKTVQPRGPYYLGGSSYGGLVAWEMACQLAQAGEAVGLLALFDTHGPGYPEYLPDISRLQFRIHGSIQLLRHHFSTLALLPGDKRGAYVFGKLSKIRVRMKRIFRRRFRRMGNLVYRWMGKALPPSLQVTQDHILTAGAAYVPRPYTGTVTVFRATEQPYGVKHDPTLGWDKVAKGPINVIEIPGYHGTMVVEPRVGLLVQKLTPLLAPEAKKLS